VRPCPPYLEVRKVAASVINIYSMSRYTYVFLTVGEAVSSVSGGEEGRSLSDEYEPNVKLYVVVACIAALVLIAIIQVTITARLTSTLKMWDENCISQNINIVQGSDKKF
jgi:hypothetical protein